MPGTAGRALLRAHAGMNRFVWNLRYAPPPPLRTPGGPVFEAGGPRTATVLPGRYTLRLTADGHTDTRTLTVTLDPRLTATPAELQAQLDLMRKIGEAIADDHRAFNQIAALGQQLTGIVHRLGDDTTLTRVVDSARALNDRAEQLAVRFFQYKAKAPKWLFMNYPLQLNGRLVSLGNSVGAADAAPTAQAAAVYKELRAELDQRLADWAAMRTRDVAALNALMQEHGITPVYVPGD